MDWASGYVTDVGYVPHFNRETSPAWLRAVCTLQNAAAVPDAPVYLELGSGQGFGLNLMAASDPRASFVGVDFLPAHVVNGRRLAEEAGLANVAFHEASFEDLARDPARLPQADVVLVHGVYTWVGPEQRASLRRIIGAVLKPGGVLHISYNCAIGWGPVAGLQKLLRDFNRARGGRSADVLETARLLQRFRDAGMPYLRDNAALSQKLDAAAAGNVAYLAHEYLNEHWVPMYAQDMIADMAECRLTFVGSARPGNNVESYSVQEAFRAAVAEERDVGLRECLKDMALNTTFRQDVFVRGPSPDPEPLWIDRLRDMEFVLTRPAAEARMEATVPRGRLQMGKAIYGRALAALGEGPVALGRLSEHGPTLHDLATVLLQTDWAEPAARPENDPAPAKALNAALARRSPTRFFACARTGSALQVTAADGRLLSALIADPAASREGLLQAGRGDPPDGEAVTPARLDAKIESWRGLGLF